MKVTRHFARRFRLLGLLRTSLALGAVADLAAAAALVLAPQLPANPSEAGGWLAAIVSEAAPVGPWLIAVLLVMLAVLWGLAARDPRRYSGVVAVAIAGRLAGAAVFGSWAVIRPDLAELWAFAVADAAFGFLHTATWLPLKA